MRKADLALVEELVVAGVALTARSLAGAGGVDLTFPQWRVMLVLGESANGATVSEVARRIGVTLPATSRQLRRMERKQLVSIEHDALDQRAMRARLTDDGRRARTRIVEFRRVELARALAGVDLDAAGRSHVAGLAAALAEFW